MSKKLYLVQVIYEGYVLEKSKENAELLADEIIDEGKQLVEVRRASGSEITNINDKEYYVFGADDLTLREAKMIDARTRKKKK